MNHIATRYFLGLVKMPWKLSWEFAVEFSYIKSDNSIKSSLKHKIVNLIGCKIESKTKKKKKKRQNVLFRQGKTHLPLIKSTPCVHMGLELEKHAQSHHFLMV